MGIEITEKIKTLASSIKRNMSLKNIHMLFFFTEFKHSQEASGPNFLDNLPFFCPYKHINLEKYSYFQTLKFYLGITLLKFEIEKKLLLFVRILFSKKYFPIR